MRLASLALLAALLLSACSDDLVGTETTSRSDNTPGTVEAGRSAEFSKFRHTQLLDDAKARRADVAGKLEVPTVHLFIGFDEYEMNGVSRRVLDQYGISRRVLDQYGITRRVLDQYGITRRILNEYGITRRVLDQYGNVIGEVPAIRGRAAFGRAVQGLAVEVEEEFLADLLAALEADDDIAYVEPNPVMMPPVPELLPDPTNEDELVPWGVERMGALLTNYQGRDNVHIVIMDSGVNESDDIGIDKAVDISMLFKDRDREYWDDAEFEQTTPVFDPKDTGDPRDYAGHGSTMATAIGAVRNGHGLVGVAPGAKMHNLKVMSDDGRTDITTLTAAIDYITWIKTDIKSDLKLVINMSLGGDIEATEFNALDIAVQRAVDAGIVVVVAAGNDSRDASTYSPAHVEDAITVGAFDRADQFAPYSNYGSFIDLLAPGSEIPAIDEAGNMVSVDGTSAAAAHVSGAVAQYWYLNPDATPLEIRDALVESARPVISGTPEGTTNRAVFIGDFARNWSADEDFEVSSAQYDEASGTLTVSGVGTRLEFVDVFRPFTGEHLGETIVDYNAEWTMTFGGLSPVPCDIRAISEGVVFEEEVRNAPAGCEQTPQFLKAEYRNGGVTIEATGTANYDLTLTSTNTGTPLFTGAFDQDGELAGSFTNFDEVPCAITLDVPNGPFSAERQVTGAPPNCDGNVFVNEAKWNRGALFLDMLGNPNASVALTSTNTGVDLGSVQLDGSGAHEATVADLPEIPCSLTVSMDPDKEMIVPVVGAPDNCDSRPFLDGAQWRGSYLQMAGLANPNTTVELWGVGLNAVVATHTADASGELDGNVYGFSAIPCELKLRMVTPDGRETWSDPMTVSSAPLNCDGRDYMELDRAEYDKGKKILKVQGVALSGTPGLEVELRYADGTPIPGARFAPDENGEFQLQLKKLKESDSPCGFIDAGFVGQESLIDNFEMGKSSSTCASAYNE